MKYYIEVANMPTTNDALFYLMEQKNMIVAPSKAVNAGGVGVCGGLSGGSGGGDHHRAGVHPVSGNPEGLFAGQRSAVPGGAGVPVRLPPAGHAGIEAASWSRRT